MTAGEHDAIITAIGAIREDVAALRATQEHQDRMISRLFTKWDMAMESLASNSSSLAAYGVRIESGQRWGAWAMRIGAGAVMLFLGAVAMHVKMAGGG